MKKRPDPKINQPSSSVTNINENFDIHEFINRNHSITESMLSPFNQNLTNNQNSNQYLEQSIHNYEIYQLNHSINEKLPIYFTNPVSGIVYSITEIGYNASKPLISTFNNNNNHEIPIYIPKEQYDRDMNLIKLKYKYLKKCRLGKQQQNSEHHQQQNHTKIHNKKKKLQQQQQQIPGVTKKPLKITNKHQKQPPPKPNESTSTEEQPTDYVVSGLENVLNDVFEVVEDEVLSSEEPHAVNILLNKKKKLKKNIIKNQKTTSITKIQNPNPNRKPRIDRKTHLELKNSMRNMKISSQLPSIPVINHKSMQLDHQSSNRHESAEPKTSIRLRKLLSVADSADPESELNSKNDFESLSANSRTTNLPIVVDKYKLKNKTPSLPLLLHMNVQHKIVKRSFNHTFHAENISEARTFTQSPSPAPLPLVDEVTKSPRDNDDGNDINIMTTVSQTSQTTKHFDNSEYGKNSKFILTTPKTTCPNCKYPKSKHKLHRHQHQQQHNDDDYYIEYSDIPFAGGDYDYGDKDDDYNEGNVENEYYDYKPPTKTNHAVSSVENLEQNDNKLPQNYVRRTKKNTQKKAKRKRKPILEHDDEDDDDDDDDDDDSVEDDDDDDDIETGIEVAPIAQDEEEPEHEQEEEEEEDAEKEQVEIEEEEEDDDLDIMAIVNLLLYPARKIFRNMVSRAGILAGLIEDDPVPIENPNNLIAVTTTKVPKYTVYNKPTEPTVTESSSWFGSWFNSESETKPPPPTEVEAEDSSGWFESWFDTNERSTTPSSSVQSSDNNYWFFNWFDSSAPDTASTTRKAAPVTESSLPQLTINANHVQNPQQWIAVLAQHIVNNTVSSSTINPFHVPVDPSKLVAYNNCRILRLKPGDDQQIKFLDEYKNTEEGGQLQWLQGPTLRGLTDVLVPQKHLNDFEDTLKYEKINHNVLIFDVGKAISYERMENNIEKLHQQEPDQNLMFWHRYQSYDQIIRFIEILQVKNPNFVELFHIGRSFEGRPLVIVKIAKKTPISPHKIKLKTKKGFECNGVFIEAGLHGREWIGPATATWIINELLKIMKSNSSSASSNYIRSQTWFIMAVLNPDGYEYSRDFDRMWSKSRSIYPAKPITLINSAINWLQQTNANKLCFGVDLKQNWEYNWNNLGSSKSPCHQFYAGPTAFSEPETRAVSQFLIDYRKKIKLFISLESYGQIIAYPNKLNGSFDKQKIDDLLDVAMVGNDALRKSGSNSRYKIDSSNEFIASKSGLVTDFVSYEAGIPFSYTIYLADNGVHGYLVPGANIESTAKDAFEIIKAMSDYI